MEKGNSQTHQHRSKEDIEKKYHNLINQFCIKNQIIPQCNINLKCISTIINSSDKLTIRPTILQYIFNSPSTYIFKSFNKTITLNYLIIIIYYHFTITTDKSKFNNYLSHGTKIIAKLFREGLFSINEVVTIAKLLLILGLYNKKEDSNKRDSQGRLNKIIINPKLIKYGFNLINDSFLLRDMLTNEEIYGINSFIDYFNDYVLANNDNSIMLSKVFDHFPLLSLIKKQSIELNSNNSNNNPMQLLSESLLNIYIHLFKFNFNNKLMKNIIEGIKDILINYRSKSEMILFGDLSLANIQIDYLKNCHIIEDQNLKKDNCQFPNGFLFQEKRKNVFKINLTSLPELSIIFGIKSLDLNNQKEKKCLMFFANFALEPFISLVLEHNKLNLEINTNKKNPVIETFHTNIAIKPFISYVLIIQFAYIKSSKATLIKISTNDNQKNETKVTNLGKVINLNCYIGCLYIKTERKSETTSKEKQVEIKYLNRFIGEIGTIIFLSTVMNENQEKLFKSLKGYYELGLFYGRFDMRNIRKYLWNYENNEEMVYEEYNYNLKESIYAVVSPMNFQLIEKGAIDKFATTKKKVVYQYSYLRNIKNNNMFTQNNKFEIIDSLETNRMILLQRNRTVIEFFKLNGLSFLSLNLEYYYQLLSSFSINSKVHLDSDSDSNMNFIIRQV